MDSPCLPASSLRKNRKGFPSGGEANMKHAQGAVKKTSKSFASFPPEARPSHGLGKQERRSRVYRQTANFRSRQSMPRSVLVTFVSSRQIPPAATANASQYVTKAAKVRWPAEPNQPRVEADASVATEKCMRQGVAVGARSQIILCLSFTEHLLQKLVLSGFRLGGAQSVSAGRPYGVQRREEGRGA